MSKLGFLAILALSLSFTGAGACDDHDGSTDTAPLRQPTDCVSSDMVYSEGAVTVDTSIVGQPLKQVCTVVDDKGKWVPTK
jgi:hypothetical protein